MTEVTHADIAGGYFQRTSDATYDGEHPATVETMCSPDEWDGICLSIVTGTDRVMVEFTDDQADKLIAALTASRQYHRGEHRQVKA